MDNRNRSENSPSPKLLIAGDFYEGSDGPTIILKLLSPAAVEWLHGVMTKLANDPEFAIDLAAQSEAHILGIRSWNLYRSSGSSDDAGVNLIGARFWKLFRGSNWPIALRGPSSVVADADFEWEMDEDGWITAAALLEPFLDGKPGHQYLTSAGHDAALVEVSFGEPNIEIVGA